MSRLKTQKEKDLNRPVHNQDIDEVDRLVELYCNGTEKEKIEESQ